MTKKLLTFLTMLILAMFVLAACSPAADDTGGDDTTTDTTTDDTTTDDTVVDDTTTDDTTTDDVMAAAKICQVTDVGGIDDKSFNATAWKGVLDAQDGLGVEGQYLESQQQTDYEQNINAFIEADCDLIITVGFLLGDATAAAAEANPDLNFAIVDFAYDPGYDNVLGMIYSTDEAAFLAGYAAAAASKTGIVATFGGIPIPPVTIFMDGFYNGVMNYNAVHEADVKVLGWDPATQEGLFTGNFESTDDGRALGETLMDEGADIIMPVAGPVGLGTAAAAQERGDVYIVGVDNDWTQTSPEYADLILTSVLKNMDVSVYLATEAILDGSFAGGLQFNNLANGGVGVAPFLPGMISSDVQAELDQVAADLIAGAEMAMPEMMEPFGTEENPLVWVLVPSQDTEAVLTGAEEIAAVIEEQTGLVVVPLVSTDFSAAVEAMCNGEAQIGALNTFNYILASARGCATVGVASVRFGSTFYSGQLITRPDTGIETVEDLAGTTFCRPDPTSTSGWIIPSITMQAAGINPETDLAEIVDAGGHDSVVLAVLNGDCDAGSTFVDARTNVEEEFPNVMEEVIVIQESPPIPNDNISFATDLDQATVDAVLGVFLDLASTDEGLEVLNSVYSWSGMEVVGDDFYDGFRQQLEAAGLSIEDLIGE